MGGKTKAKDEIQNQIILRPVVKQKQKALKLNE